MEKYAVYGIGLLAVLGYSSLAVLAKKPSEALSPFFLIVMNSVIIGLPALALVLWYEPKIEFSKIEPSIWVFIVLNGIVNLFAFWLFVGFAIAAFGIYIAIKPT